MTFPMKRKTKIDEKEYERMLEEIENRKQAAQAEKQETNV